MTGFGLYEGHHWTLTEPPAVFLQSKKVNMGLHLILQHLDRTGTYVRILFVNFSYAFNTIIP